MTHIEQMIAWFRGRNRMATLGEILTCGQPWAYEFRARMTDARKKGHNFICHKGPLPTKNVYILSEPSSEGQYEMFDNSGIGAH